MCENRDKRPEFLKIDNMEDGKGGSLLLNVSNIASVRYFVYGVPSQPCLEFGIIDGCYVRITGKKAENIWSDLRKIFSIWEDAE